MCLETYVLWLLSAARDNSNPVRTGAELVKYWSREGVIGSRADITDSQSLARSIREAAERRKQ